MHNEEDTARSTSATEFLPILAEALFLLNLTFLPGISLLVLLWLQHKYRDHPSPLVRNHFQQVVRVSLWSTSTVILLVFILSLVGSLQSLWSWAAVEAYFICFHAPLMVMGAMGLNHAVLGRSYRYPLLGPLHCKCTRP